MEPSLEELQRQRELLLAKRQQMLAQLQGTAGGPPLSSAASFGHSPPISTRRVTEPVPDEIDVLRESPPRSSPFSSTGASSLTKKRKRSRPADSDFDDDFNPSMDGGEPDEGDYAIDGDEDGASPVHERPKKRERTRSTTRSAVDKRTPTLPPPFPPNRPNSAPVPPSSATFSFQPSPSPAAMPATASRKPKPFHRSFSDLPPAAPPSAPMAPMSQALPHSAPSSFAAGNTDELKRLIFDQQQRLDSLQQRFISMETTFLSKLEQLQASIDQLHSFFSQQRVDAHHEHSQGTAYATHYDPNAQW